MTKPSYWQSIIEKEGLFQMGPLSHRLYLLNLLKSKGVKSILDVGCGTGPIYQLISDTYDMTKDGIMEIRKWDFDYKGVDPSFDMIQACQKHFPKGNWDVQDARNLPEAENSWDCVLLMHSLDYVYEYQKAIDEARRVAKKYVCIVLWRPLTYGEDAKSSLNNTVDGDLAYDWNLAHVQDFAWKDLEQAFTNAKLKVVSKEDGEIVNKENIHKSNGHIDSTTNTVILLEKYD